MNEEVRTEMGKVAEVLRWLSNESLKKGDELKSEFHKGQGIGLMRAVIYLEDEYLVLSRYSKNVKGGIESE